MQPNTREESTGFSLALAASNVEINFDVLSPDGAEIVESVSQTFTYDRSTNTLTPLKAQNFFSTSFNGRQIHHIDATARAMTWRGLHPRYRVVSPQSGTGDHSYQVSLGFVDVSRYFARLNPSFLSSFSPRSSANKDPHFGCTLYALEYLTGKIPKLWFVIVPPSLNTEPEKTRNPFRHDAWDPRKVPARDISSDIGVLYFFRPNSKATYHDLVQVRNLDRFTIYMKDDETNPFFIDHWSRWILAPSRGLERQLVESNKKCIFVHPWPSAADFGDAATAQAPRLLQEIITTLHCRGALSGNKPQKLRLGRLAVGGYSHGGKIVDDMWRDTTLRSSFDELYLFDPQGRRNAITKTFESGLPTPQELRQWVDPQGKKRIFRLVGGSIQHTAGLALVSTTFPQWKKTLAAYEQGVQGVSPPPLWCRPVERDFWEGKGVNNYYAWAFWPQPGSVNAPYYVPKTTTVPPPTFSSLSGPPTTLTQMTGIRIVKEDARGLMVTAPPLSTRLTFVDVSSAELSGFAALYWSKYRTPPLISSIKDLKTFFEFSRDLIVFGQTPGIKDKENDLGHGVRHQWAICGGEGNGTKGPSFKGYLFLCLRDSGFPI
jgi:hypothetical protein